MGDRGQLDAPTRSTHRSCMGGSSSHDQELTPEDMLRLLGEVGEYMVAKGETGEVILAGGAVMMLVVGSRASSRDIDVVFSAGRESLREAVAAVAAANGLTSHWLNDAVSEFVAADAPTDLVRELPGLTVRAVTLDYMVYMKAWAGGSIDFQDLRALVKALGLTNQEQVLRIIERYSPAPAGPGGLPREMQIMVESLFP